MAEMLSRGGAPVARDAGHRRRGYLRLPWRVVLLLYAVAGALLAARVAYARAHHVTPAPDLRPGADGSGGSQRWD